MSGGTLAEETRHTIVLGVTGSIAAYKACEIVRDLTRRGYRVKVVMTEAATRFVGPLTFRTLTGEPVGVSLWDDAPHDPVHHISLAKEASVFAIAPCTANVMAKLAAGRADDLLTTTALATDAPVVLAPAMNDRMWAEDVTQENATTLRRRGFVFVGPGTGDLACGDQGRGRLAEVPSIVGAVVKEAERARSLTGVRVLVTAGGTREPVDPVRFLGNRSSGRTGAAVAEEAARRGADVTLVMGSATVPDPFGCDVVPVQTAQEMRDETVARAESADVVVMAAAVADYRPVVAAAAKIKKGEGGMALELERTPDALAEVGGLPGERVLVGFAAETGDPVAAAREKLARKRADLIVANDVSREGLGFGSAANQVVFVTADDAEETPVLDKTEIAAVLLDRVASLLSSKGRE